MQNYMVKFYYMKANFKCRCFKSGHTGRANSVTREVIFILKCILFFFIILELTSLKNGPYE